MNATHIPRTPGVYLIQNEVNGKVYVGFSSRDVRERIYAHFGNLEKGIHVNYLIQNDWNLDNSRWISQLIEITNDANRELFWIDYYKSNLTGYNIDYGHKRGQYTKDKIKQNCVGNTGRKFSEEHKNKLKEIRQKDALSRANTVKRNRILRTIKYYEDKCLPVPEFQLNLLKELED